VEHLPGSTINRVAHQRSRAGLDHKARSRDHRMHYVAQHSGKCREFEDSGLSGIVGGSGRLRFSLEETQVSRDRRHRQTGWRGNRQLPRRSAWWRRQTTPLVELKPKKGVRRRIEEAVWVPAPGRGPERTPQPHAPCRYVSDLQVPDRRSALAPLHTPHGPSPTPWPQASRLLPHTHTHRPGSAPITSSSALPMSFSAPITSSSALPMSFSAPITSSSALPMSFSAPITSSSALPMSSSAPIASSSALPMSSSAPITSSSALPTSFSAPVLIQAKMGTK
jgi:hypothetical protein